jgi:hypothetical protein
LRRIAAASVETRPSARARPSSIRGHSSVQSRNRAVSADRFLREICISCGTGERLHARLGRTRRSGLRARRRATSSNVTTWEYHARPHGRFQEELCASRSLASKYRASSRTRALADVHHEISGVMLTAGGELIGRCSRGHVAHSVLLAMPCPGPIAPAGHGTGPVPGNLTRATDVGSTCCVPCLDWLSPPPCGAR